MPSLLRLAGLLGVVYAATTGAMVAAGRSPVLPFGLALYLTVAVLPFGVGLASAGLLLDRLKRPVAVVASLLIGVVAVLTFRYVVAWGLAAVIISLPVRRQFDRRTALTFAIVLAIVAAGHGSVWNGNILAASAVGAPTQDELLMKADLWLYQSLGLAADYDGVFPIVRVPAAFHLLEEGYLAVFPELITVLVYLTLHEPRRLGGALAGLYAAYAVALVVFVVFPTAGPCIVYPASLAGAFRSTETGTLMASMASSFAAVRSGVAPKVAYFVAFPSLHVAVGVYLPLLARRCRALLYILLPSSVLIVLSTFLLGYHYAIDAVAAIPVAWLSLRVAERYTALTAVDGAGTAVVPDRSAVAMRGPQDALLRAVWIEHRPLLMVVTAFVAAAGPVLLALGRPYPLRLTTVVFAGMWAAISTGWLLFCWLRGPRHLAAALRPNRLSGALLVAAIAVPTQITFQAVKQSIGMLRGFPFDPWLHRIDVALHGQEPWRYLAWAVTRAEIIRTLDAAYSAWFVLVIASVIWLSWSGNRGLRMRALVAMTLLWVGAGNLLALLVPSAGPCYYDAVVPGPSPYAPLMASLDELARHGAPLIARVSQVRLWDISRADGWTQFVGISAMPSLHVAVAVLMAIVAWHRSRAAGLAMAVFAVAIMAGSVALGWHYAIDGYVGAACAWASWVLAGRVVQIAATPDTSTPA